MDAGGGLLSGAPVRASAGPYSSSATSRRSLKASTYGSPPTRDLSLTAALPSPRVLVRCNASFGAGALSVRPW